MYISQMDMYVEPVILVQHCVPSLTLTETPRLMIRNEQHPSCDPDSK